MMKILLCLILFTLCYYLGDSAPPFLPRQIAFSIDKGQIVYAIDEINQRAYQSVTYSFTPVPSISYALQRFPYAPSDSPQSKNYVQLLLGYSSLKSCEYATYWRYAGNYFNAFPSHWLNGSSFEIKNYLNFPYTMLRPNTSSPDEDYWYTNEICRIQDGSQPPCQEIYFKKNTEIPLRSTQVVYQESRFIQITTNFKIISIGKPDEKYFNSIPKNWATICEDLDLGLSYSPESTTIKVNQSAQFHVSLSTQPHRINGNGTVRVQWNTTQCIDCFTLSPKQFTFSVNNFQEKQILTITRIKNAPRTLIIPIFDGEGFNFIPPERFPIYID